MAYVKLKTKNRIKNKVKKVKHMRTNSGAKKRFFKLPSGLIKVTQACKRHSNRKKSNSMLNKATGLIVACKSVFIRIKKFLRAG